MTYSGSRWNEGAVGLPGRRLLVFEVEKLMGVKGRRGPCVLPSFYRTLDIRPLQPFQLLSLKTKCSKETYYNIGRLFRGIM